MKDEISVITVKNVDLSKIESAVPFRGDAKSRVVTEVVEGDDIRTGVQEICASLRPEAVDPDGNLGIDEIELSLVVCGSAGVRLIGEANISAQASIKVKLKRK